MKKELPQLLKPKLFSFSFSLVGKLIQKMDYLSFALTLLILCFSQSAKAQDNFTVAGTVAGEDGQGLPGATVRLKEVPSIGTTSDIDGNYRFSIPATYDEGTLVISYVGYVTEERLINGQSVIDVQLLPDLQTLSELVVIGYGSVKKSDVTGAVTVVDDESFNKGAINSAQELIQGKAAGVSIISDNGAPGNNSTIRIRGGASLNASNDPLIVIDGVPIENDRIGGSSNILAMLNPNDIESFTILKDASATSIYGSRGSNGVILITTKGGKEDFSVNYNVVTSLYTTPDKIDVYTGDEYRALVNEVYAGNEAVTSLLGEANTDWQSEIYQDAFGQDHNLSVSGTVKDMPYRVSLGYNNTDGVLKTYNFERTTVGISLDPSFLNDHLRVNINVKGMDNNNNFAEQGAIANAVYYDPTQPVYNGNTRWYGYTTWTTGGIDGDANNLATANPVAQLDLTNNTSNVKRSIGNIQLDYRLPFMPDLRANLNLAYDYTIAKGSNDAAKNTSWVYIPTVDGGRISPYENESKNQLLDFYLNYSKKLRNDEDQLDVTGGYSWSHFYRQSADSLLDQNMVVGRPANLFATEYNLVAFFGRANYSIKDKYLLTFSVRQDGTSRFGEDFRWGLFPAGAFAWDISEEAFLKNSKTISNLKLRLGYGITGQQNLQQGNYPYLATYSISNETARYRFGETFYNTLRPDGYEANLKWEETTTANIGLDFGFLKGRLSGSLDYYYRETEDLLSTVTLAAGTNFYAAGLTNIGTMENYGIELNLNAAVVETTNFSWNLGYNISYNKNEITKLNLNNDPDYFVPVGGIGGTTSGTIQAHRVGYPVNTFFVYKQIYDEDGNPLESAYEDLNNDGVINTSDLYSYKQPAPIVMMGINSQFNYNKWQLSFSGRANLGNYVYNNVASSSTYRGLFGVSALRNSSVLADETQFTTGLNTVFSDFYIENASFFRMDNINLAYQFDKLFSNKLDLQLSAGMQNAFVITKYKGLDPEVSNGLDNNIFPRSRVYLVGLNVGF